MVRLLYIHRGSVPPPRSELHDRFFHLSRICSGDVLLPVWWKTQAEAQREIGSFPEFGRGSFTYHLLPEGTSGSYLPTVTRSISFVRRVVWLVRNRGPYDVVMSYGTNSTGLAALAASRLCRAKLIVELPGVPEDAYLLESSTVGGRQRAQHALADAALTLVVRSSQRVKLLYPEQLAAYPSLRRVPSSVFHDFVPVGGMTPEASDGSYALVLGHPWYVKGVDVAIEAFRSIAERVPRHRLRVIGHLRDRARLDELAGGCPQIELLPPVSHVDALAAIASCSLLVLPSRSEAMGRVLVEAMAAGKPIVASRVGGIPHYVRDGENGLLVTPGSVPELAARMLEVLCSPELARRLGKRGQELARGEYDEAAYVRCFAQMLTDMGFSVPVPASAEGACVGAAGQSC